MCEREKRYLLFADILGTRELYSAKPPKADLLERKRDVLGHVTRIAVFPFFNKDFDADLKINIFSDTVLVASASLPVLMKAAARLFYCFSTETQHAESPDQLFLLRGGISHGDVLRSESVTPSRNVEIATIFDTSLALAYQLERIRKGSRLFMCDFTFDSARQAGIDFCHSWHTLTGIGPAISPAFEYYWPATLFGSDDDFLNYLESLFDVWYNLFTAQPLPWRVEAYNRTLYHLDETIKLVVRSAAHSPEPSAQATWAALIKLLPIARPTLAKLDIRFTWGTWFQVLWVLLQLRAKYSWLDSENGLNNLIKHTLDVVRVHKYIPTFFSELQNSDYSWFRERLKELELP